MMVQKITQQNQVRVVRAAHAVADVVQVWRLPTAAAGFYRTPSMPTEILRLGRFAPGTGDDREETIATAVAHDADARDVDATGHSDERGDQIYGQIT
jgi:hypothetical protein